jgi:hypothetical protein
MNNNTLESILKEADQAEKSQNFFQAAHLYKSALKKALKSANSETISFIKTKLVEMNQKSQKEFKSIEIEQELPQEKIDEIINRILNQGNLEKSLEAIGLCSGLCPQKKRITETYKKSMPLAFQLATLTTITDKGHMVKRGSDGEYSWFIEIYKINQGISETLLLKLFYQLMKSKKLDEKSLEQYLDDTKIFPANSLKILKIGIHHYFAEDYISALHILIPQFEGIFLHLSELLGIDTIALNQENGISTTTKTLSSLYLSSDKFTNAWGEDFCQQIDFVLFEPLGYKLRHRTAHGEISAEECNILTTSIMIYFFLVLAANIKTQETLS